MSSKIGETMENEMPEQKANEMCCIPELDIKLQSKLNSDTSPSKDKLVDAVPKNGGPLSERQLSNFDNQANVEQISN